MHRDDGQPTRVLSARTARQEQQGRAKPDSVHFNSTQTEYFAGANAAGPYLTAKALSELPFAYGPMLLVTILYWMTGACGSVPAFRAMDGWICV